MLRRGAVDLLQLVALFLSLATICIHVKTRANECLQSTRKTGRCRTQAARLRRTSEVSIGEDAEEGEGVAVHSVIGVRGVQTLQQVSDVAHMDASLAHSVRFWRGEREKKKGYSKK